ncbi:MAG TPA: type VI secretion system baseplate subunit TssE [Phycisphaerae bacterium]|jgi:type VI secretion system protein ImpF|nr:type VI secretion system baseplate subunit TssE [Phycisphaerae bacterium]
MAEMNPRDRLQPFLLDRLTDDQSEQTRESRDRHVFSPRQLRESLLRDLAWLLNTPAPIAEEGIGEFTQAASSVLNYGIPDLTGTTSSSIPGAALERSIYKAIQLFEPRLERHGLSVKLLDSVESGSPNVIALEISGEIMANQLADPLYIKTEIDLETGQFSLKDRPHG